jgi:hypothetical protein
MIGSVTGGTLARYVGTIVFGFLLFFLLTRPSIPIGDAKAFLNMALSGDPALLHYGEPSHFLQVPMARVIWLTLEGLGLPVSLEGVLVAISLTGTLAAVVFFGLIAAEILRTPAAAWVGAVLFGTSLNISTQWNGELYGLALGFVTAGLFFALRGRLVLPSLLWALSVLSHSEFALAAPAFIGAVWIAQSSVAGTGQKVQRVSAVMAMAAVAGGIMLLAGSWVVGKWVDAMSFAGWLRRSYETRQPDLLDHPEVGRALKGLLTAYTVAGHYWRDILTGRGSGTSPFLLAAAVGLLVIAFTSVLLAASIRQRRLVLFGLAWLVPFHVLVNWWFLPTVEKYHAGALPGFVLLVTGGLITITEPLRARRRYLLYGVYVSACVGLNLFGALLPIQALGRDIARAEREIRRLTDARGGKAVFIACDASRVLVGAGVPFLRLRSVWKGTVPEIRQATIAWTSDRLREGKEPYLVGRWCLPEEWNTKWSKEPFDLFFLEQSFKMASIGIAAIPISESVPTNPFSWTQGDVVRLEPDE